MDHCVLAGSPTQAFIERFKRAVELFEQYSLQEPNLTCDDLARKAVKEAGFIEQDLDQVMFESMVMAYHCANNASDKEMVIAATWNQYNNM